MAGGPQISFLPDGRRLHLHHGPIDLIVDARGAGRAAALAAAARRFGTVLEELVAELDLLRMPLPAGHQAVSKRPGKAFPNAFPTPRGKVAQKMAAAVSPFAALGIFVTPMAAVAGAVADEILRVMVAAGPLRRAWVNNGGDVALHLAPGGAMTAAVAGVPGGRIRIPARSPVRGVATSGWRGRSHSLGIADAVTVLARSAARADAAATLIANAVDLPGSPKVRRRPACELAPDSDLGERPVTVGVASLDAAEIAAALNRGLARAEAFRRRGLIAAALLSLSGQARLTGAAQIAALAETSSKETVDV